ncbi:hypothetical protein BGX29_010285 [Mortierella sp. GBA35]|nr:hypothetical protein BGX29_010285 [Mortierella sp. GBA35]
MASLLLIPEEIRQLIGSYLDKATLGIGIQVCRPLHSSFIPLLWKQAELRGGIEGGCEGEGEGGIVEAQEAANIDPCCISNSSNSNSFVDIENCRSPARSPLSQPTALIDLPLLQARCRHIEHLTISGPVPSEYCSIVFPRLRTLVFTDTHGAVFDGWETVAAEGSEIDSSSGDEEAALSRSCLDMIQLARLNPTIERLVINNVHSSLPARFWDTVFMHWRNPKALVIRYSPVSKSSGGSLWRASTRFEDLEFLGVNLPRYAAINTAINTITSSPASSDDHSSSPTSPLSSPSSSITASSFPTIKRLHLSITPRRNHFFDPSQQLLMMQSCPQLQELVWDCTHFHMDSYLTTQFIDALRHTNTTNNNTTNTTCWPMLDSLVILQMSFRRNSNSNINNNTNGRRVLLAEMFQALQPLRSLQIRFGRWEPFAFGALKDRHFKTLQTLSIQGCKGFTSSMVHEILTLCPCLVDFAADFIYAQDILSGGCEKVPGTTGTATTMMAKPWVCLGLKRLKICIYATALDSQTPSCARQVLRHLSTLTRLRDLDLRRNLVDERGLLDLSLRSGLDNLGGLARMETFRFDGSIRTMGEEELFWMLGRWRCLEELTGPFLRKGGGLLVEEVRDLLRERHILYSV